MKVLLVICLNLSLIANLVNFVYKVSVSESDAGDLIALYLSTSCFILGSQIKLN